MLIAANEIIISTRLTTRHDSPGCESRVRHIRLPHVAQGQSKWQWQWHLLPLTALPLSWGYKPNICVCYTMRDCVCVCLCYKSFNWVISFPLQTSDSEASLYRATNKWGEKKTQSKFDLLHVYAQGVWAPRNDAQKYARPFFPRSVCAP